MKGLHLWKLFSIISGMTLTVVVRCSDDLRGSLDPIGRAAVSSHRTKFLCKEASDACALVLKCLRRSEYLIHLMLLAMDASKPSPCASLLRKPASYLHVRQSLRAVRRGVITNIS